MKKSLIGMLLLGIMILTRALLIEDGGTIGDRLTRGNSFAMVNDDFIAQQLSEVAPKTHLGLSLREVEMNIKDSDVSGIQVNSIESNQNNTISNSELFADNHPADIQNEEYNEEEVIPMDYVSNTGYGSWNPKLNSEAKGQNESYPLDRGNTISDNISKLFPLKSPH